MASSSKNLTEDTQFSDELLCINKTLSALNDAIALLEKENKPDTQQEIAKAHQRIETLKKRQDILLSPSLSDRLGNVRKTIAIVDESILLIQKENTPDAQKEVARSLSHLKKLKQKEADLVHEIGKKNMGCYADFFSPIDNEPTSLSSQINDAWEKWIVPLKPKPSRSDS